MFEFIGIFGDVIRIVTFQRSYEPIRNGFAPHDRHRFQERARVVSVPRIGRNATRTITPSTAG